MGGYESLHVARNTLLPLSSLRYRIFLIGEGIATIGVAGFIGRDSFLGILSYTFSVFGVLYFVVAMNINLRGILSIPGIKKQKTITKIL